MSVFRNLLMSLTGGWAGKPADWADIRKDCPTNSIALYAAHSILPPTTYTVEGELTIVDNVASGFSNQNYVVFDRKFNYGANIELNFEITTGSIGTVQTIYDDIYNTDNDSKHNGLSVVIVASNKFGLTMGNGGSWIINSLGSTTVLANTKYYLKVTFNGSDWKLLSSTDNENWTTEVNYNSSLYPTQNLEGIIGFSRRNLPAFTGSIKLNNIYNSVINYDNLGFTATCTGGYNVFIDGTQYGSTYASGAQCNITWSTSGIMTGDIVTTPSLLKAHKIWIEPATEGANITAFKFQRVADSGSEEQGCLWTHFNIQNQIELTMFGNSVDVMGVGYRNALMKAITAKSNKLSVSSLYYAFINLTNLEYIPEFVYASNFNVLLEYTFDRTAITSLTIKDTAISSLIATCRYCEDLTSVKLLNVNLSGLEHASQFIVNSTKLKDTVFDFSSASLLKEIGIYGDSSHFIGGMKGLRVSSSAPFDYATSPQINVSYTGMDRQALVTLFNDLPTVSAGQIINITGCTGSQQLSDDEIAIAENKGWTVMGGPAYQVYATYNASVGDTIKLNDGMATSDYAWSAYPSDTAITGSYTQTATVTAVGENNIIECNKPTQDNKTATVSTDKHYYAFTNYNDASDTLYSLNNPPTPISSGSSFTQPTLSANGTLGGNSFAVSLTNPYSATYDAWKAFDNNSSTCFWTQTIPADLIIYNPEPLKVTALHWVVYDYNRRPTDWEWYGSNDNITYTLLNSGTNTSNDFTLDLTGGAYKYHKFKVVTAFNELNARQIDLTAEIYEQSVLFEKVSDNFVEINPQPEFTVGINSITVTSETPNITYNRNSDNDEVEQITSNIEVIDNTTIQTATIISDQDATIETSTSVTTDNNGVVITDGSRHNFNITVPSSLVSIMQNGGQYYDVANCPLTFEANSGVGLLLKNGNDVYYRNSWVITRDYDLHYQQINFSYPSGATITCRVNNVLQSDLTPYCYAGDTITWTCDNAGTVTTGSYTVQYSSKDGNIQTIIIS